MLLSLKVLVLWGVVAVAGPQHKNDVPLIDEGLLQSAGLAESWQAHLPLGKEDMVQAAYLVDEALYVVTDEGLVFALKADVGLLRWGAKLTERNYKVRRPTHLHNADGTGPVIIPTTNGTFVYDRYSGNLLRSLVPGFPPGSAIVGYGNTLFAGSSNGRFYSLALSRQRAGRVVTLWEVEAGGPVTATPVLYGGNKLLFASQNGVVFSCIAVGKGFDWAFRTKGSILGDPVVDESGVYVASLDRSLYKIHRGIGREIWRTRFPSPLPDGPIVTAHTVYQFCPDHGLFAVDAANGEEKWVSESARSFVAHSGDRDVLFTRDRRLEVVGHETGDVLQSIDAAPAVVAVSNAQDDAMYLLARDGRVLCARMESAPYLRLQQVQAARERLNLPPLDEAAMAQQGTQDRDDQEDRSGDPLRSRRDRAP